MQNKNWLIYGAYGYTGVLIAEEALRRGHRPVLAGRDAKKLTLLAERLGLDWAAFDLQNEQTLKDRLQNFSLVYNTAGPFTHTAARMARACLEVKTHYVDVAGEVSVLDDLLSLGSQARQKGIALIPGLGFDVIAADCMARYVAQKIDAPTHLEIATVTSITDKPSPGTLKSVLDSLPQGTLHRRGGAIVKKPAGQGEKRVRFLDRERVLLPVTLGDLVSAYHTTAIPNITTFIGLPEREAALYKRSESTYQRLFSVAFLRRLAQRFAGATVKGPDENARQTGRSQIWVCARNDAGVEREAWLETLEAYRFTAVAGVLGVEEILANPVSGALTPSLAFGADFVLRIPGSKRMDINRLQ